jgi:hypothetical protein
MMLEVAQTRDDEWVVNWKGFGKMLINLREI